MSIKNLFCTALPVLASGACLTTAAHAASGATTVLNGSTPKWANSQNFVSGTDSTHDVGFRVYLGWTDPTGAAAIAALLLMFLPRSDDLAG